MTQGATLRSRPTQVDIDALRAPEKPRVLFFCAGTGVHGGRVKGLGDGGGGGTGTCGGRGTFNRYLSRGPREALGHPWGLLQNFFDAAAAG